MVMKLFYLLNVCCFCQALLQNLSQTDQLKNDADQRLRTEYRQTVEEMEKERNRLLVSSCIENMISDWEKEFGSTILSWSWNWIVNAVSPRKWSGETGNETENSIKLLCHYSIHLFTYINFVWQFEQTLLVSASYAHIHACTRSKNFHSILSDHHKSSAPSNQSPCLNYYLYLYLLTKLYLYLLTKFKSPTLQSSTPDHLSCSDTSHTHLTIVSLLSPFGNLLKKKY